MVSESVKKQMAVEKALQQYNHRKLDPGKTWEENLGPVGKWVIQVGEHTLFLNPFNSHWMYFDYIHGSWEKSGYRAGEGFFFLDDKGEFSYQKSPDPKVIPPLHLGMTEEAEGLLPFREREQEFLDLSVRRLEGSLDERSFREEVYKLRLQDQAGVWWQVREEDGGWFRWNGSQWERAVPGQDVE